MGRADLITSGIPEQLSAGQIIEQFRQRGVSILLVGERLGIRAPKGVLNDSDKHLLALNKAHLIEHLQQIRNNPYQEFPLTDIQQAYWVGRGSMTLGNIGCHAYRELTTDSIDVQRLQAAWQQLIERHQMLQVVITTEGRQRVKADLPPYQIRELDLRTHPDPQAELSRLRKEMSHNTFDPALWPLFDIRVTRLDQEVRIHIGMVL